MKVTDFVDREWRILRFDGSLGVWEPGRSSVVKRDDGTHSRESWACQKLTNVDGRQKGVHCPECSPTDEGPRLSLLARAVPRSKHPGFFLERVGALGPMNHTSMVAREKSFLNVAQAMSEDGESPERRRGVELEASMLSLLVQGWFRLRVEGSKSRRRSCGLSGRTGSAVEERKGKRRSQVGRGRDGMTRL